MDRTREIVRRGLIEHLAAHDVRFIALFAAAGYGKTTVARQLADRFERTRVCDLANINTVRDAAMRIALALAPDPQIAAQGVLPADADAALFVDFTRRLWLKAESVDLIVFENAEFAKAATGVEAELAALLSQMPRARRAVICSRAPLNIPFVEFALPHEVAVVDERVLSFTRDELAELLPPQFSGVDAVYAVTRGWPLCVRLVSRLSEARDFANLVQELRSVQFSVLHEYLIKNVFDLLDDFTRSLAIALTLTDLTADDIRRLFPETAERALRSLSESPFITRQGEHWMLHPLIRTSIQKWHEGEARAMLRNAADRAFPEDRVRAAVLYAELGDFEAAAYALDLVALAFAREPSDPDFGLVIERIPTAILLRRPRLFSAAMLFAGLAVTAEARLQTAYEIRKGFDGSEDRETRIALDVTIANALGNLGRHEEALKYGEAFARNDDATSQLYAHLLLGGMGARMGRYGSGIPHWLKLKELARGAPSTLAIMINEVLVRGARSRGKFAAEAEYQTESLTYARASKNPTILTLTLIEAIFGAWFRGDEAAFASLAAEFDDIRFPSIMPGTRLFRSCVSGALDDLTPDTARAQVHTYAYLIGLGFASADLQHKVALAAIEASDRANEPFLQCIARIALSALDASSAARWLSEAQEMAERVDSQPLHEAIADLRKGGVPAMLNPFLGRIWGIAPLSDRYRVSLFDRTLMHGGVTLHPTRREFELLAYLAFRDREVTKDELAEAFAPDASSPDADRLIRVVITRIRKKFGEQLVSSTRRGYVLGPKADVPLRAIRERILRCQAEKHPSAADRVALRRDVFVLEKYLEGRRLDYEWAEELDASLEDLADSARRLLQSEREE